MALARDMRGVQSSVLASPYWDEFMLDAPYDVTSLVASAFARYPYPETFFAWRGEPAPERVVFFNRSDRPPAWMTGEPGPNRFPVAVGHDPGIAADLVHRIAEDVKRGRRFSIFETSLAGHGSYQVVVRLLYKDAFREHLQGAFGFTVSLSWVRREYFAELTRQVARISGGEGGLSLAVLDANKATIAGTVSPNRRGQVSRRTFPLMFFDPALVVLDRPADLLREAWEVQVKVGDDGVRGAAIWGGSRTFILAALSSGVLAIGLALTARAARATARLAEMRSDFVSGVTHELKTPIATIRAAGDTLVRGRIASPDGAKEYAQLVVQEAKRLTRLVDNLLAYARITDVTEAYFFEPVDMHTLVSDAEQEFQAQIRNDRVDVETTIPPALPPIRADRAAMGLVLANLLDNALRYSTGTPQLRISARADNQRVVLEIADNGVGIPQDEISKVTRKFFRGRRAASGGSGLGLAIVLRVITDHGGSLAIESLVGSGTTVAIAIPMARGGDDEANSGG
jgi:signal transduction histidine kinase